MYYANVTPFAYFSLATFSKFYNVSKNSSLYHIRFDVLLYR